MTSNAYKRIMWGILLSGFHITFSFVIFSNLTAFEIIPSFIGYYIMIKGVKELCYECNGNKLFHGVYKYSIALFVLSGVRFILGILFGYDNSPMQGFNVIMLLIELIVYADLLNMSVKILKESNRISQADKMRKSRMTAMKFGFALAILCAVTMIPVLMDWLDYACVTFTFIFKIFVSLLVQNMSKLEVTINQENKL